MPIVIASLLPSSFGATCVAAVGQTPLSITVAILGVGFLIFFHELGHFLACRATKTRVETFSIGFGPRLFGWEYRDGVRRFTVGGRRSPASEGTMDVRISIVPLGGYVKMAGENPGERKTGASDEFPSKPFSARLLIITAGVIMNAIAAVACLTVAYLAGLKETPAVIGAVGDGGPAWRAGLRAGDHVKALDGDPVRSFDELKNEIVFLRTGQQVRLDIERAGKPMSVTVVAAYDVDQGAPQMKIAPAGTWTADDGHGPALVVAPEDRVTVAGRYAFGGYAAAMVAQEALSLGIKSVEIVFLDRPGVLPRAVDVWAVQHKPEGKPEYRIGVALRAPLIVERVLAGGAAEAAGLRPDDEIASADGAAAEKRPHLAFLPSIGTIEVRRAGGPTTIRVDAKDPVAVASFLGGIQFRASDSLVVDVDGSVFEIEGGKSPAAEAGVKSGDRVLALGDKPVSTWKDLLAGVKELTGEPVLVRVQTGVEPPRDVRVTPRAALVLGSQAPVQAVFDVQFPKIAVPVSGPFDALGLAAKRTVREIRNIFRTIRSLVTGDVSADKNLGGPGTLVTIASQSFSDSWSMFLMFIAIISVNLCVLNILPIPVLDGGHLLFLVIEKIKGSPVREATIAKAQIVGLVLLLALMVFAVRNDFRLGSR